MAIRVGGNDGGSFRRRKQPARIVRGQQQKPFRPLENPFPQKEAFRFGTYKILEEKDDYLICEGYDPLAKNPATEYTPSAIRIVHVAKPPLLMRAPWHGQTVELYVGGSLTPVTFSYTGIGVRTATATVSEEEVVETQRITMDYLEGDSIVAVEVSRNAWQAGLEVNDVIVTNESGGVISWIDLNVSGRCWAKEE